MSRYNSTSLTKDNKGKSRRGTTIIPTVPRSESDIYITTTTPERLDKLAHSFYEDTSLWWIIAEANGIGKGTFIIPSNTNLRIPNKSNIQDLIIQTNRNR